MCAVRIFFTELRVGPACIANNCPILYLNFDGKPYSDDTTWYVKPASTIDVYVPVEWDMIGDHCWDTLDDETLAEFLESL